MHERLKGRIPCYFNCKDKMFHSNPFGLQIVKCGTRYGADCVCTYMLIVGYG